jgi:hypothetical protein
MPEPLPDVLDRLAAVARCYNVPRRSFDRAAADLRALADGMAEIRRLRADLDKVLRLHLIRGTGEHEGQWGLGLQTLCRLRMTGYDGPIYLPSEALALALVRGAAGLSSDDEPSPPSPGGLEET